MAYDFDTIIDRRNSDSVKWNYVAADVLPMWVADMDFYSPQPIIDALQRRGGGRFRLCVPLSGALRDDSHACSAFMAGRWRRKRLCCCPALCRG